MSIFDTGAFNEGAIEYCSRAMKLSEIPREKQEGVISDMQYLFDTVSASGIIS